VPKCPFAEHDPWARASSYQNQGQGRSKEGGGDEQGGRTQPRPDLQVFRALYLLAKAEGRRGRERKKKKRAGGGERKKKKKWKKGAHEACISGTLIILRGSGHVPPANGRGEKEKLEGKERGGEEGRGTGPGKPADRSLLRSCGRFEGENEKVREKKKREKGRIGRGGKKRDWTASQSFRPSPSAQPAFLGGEGGREKGKEEKMVGKGKGKKGGGKRGRFLDHVAMSPLSSFLLPTSVSVA